MYFLGKQRKQILQSVINYDVNRLPKRMKFVENDESRANFCMSKNSLTYVKNVIFENINFDYDVMKRHKPLYDTFLKMVINRATFHICTSSRFGGVKTHTQAEETVV